MCFSNSIVTPQLVATHSLRPPLISLRSSTIARSFGSSSNNHGSENIRKIHTNHAALIHDSDTTANPLISSDSTPSSSLHSLPPHHRGAIHLIVGPMFAGKTKELLRRVEHYESQGLNVAVVKSDKDTRYSANQLATHDGLLKPCFAVSSLTAFIDVAGPQYNEIDVIAIDEAQFFTDLTTFTTTAADNHGKTVLLAGLDGDFQRKKFGSVLDLVPLADSVSKLHAECRFCAQDGKARPALFSLRIAADKKQELVGGADTYAPACRYHYVQMHSRGDDTE